MQRTSDISCYVDTVRQPASWRQSLAGMLTAAINALAAFRRRADDPLSLNLDLAKLIAFGRSSPSQQRGQVATTQPGARVRMA